jgi:hypothetical protein
MLKIVDEHGFLLGTAQVPMDWQEDILRGVARERVLAKPYKPMDMMTLSTEEFLKENMAASSFKRWTLGPSYSERGAAMIYGLTLEEFEKIPGVYFSPSLALVDRICAKAIGEFDRIMSAAIKGDPEEGFGG